MIHIDEIRLCGRRRIQSSFRTSIFSSTVMSSICSICFAAALRLFWCSSYSSSLHHRTEMMSSSSSIKEMTSLSFYSAMFTSSEITSYRHVSWSTIMLRVDKESESCSYCWWSARYWILNECCRSRILYSRKLFRTRSATDDVGSPLLREWHGSQSTSSHEHALNTIVVGWKWCDSLKLVRDGRSTNKGLIQDPRVQWRDQHVIALYDP
jgi:hypothetical protein